MSDLSSDVAVDCCYPRVSHPFNLLGLLFRHIQFCLWLSYNIYLTHTLVFDNNVKFPVSSFKGPSKVSKANCLIN